MRLSQHSDYAFLLESVEKGNQYSRYSFIGIKPRKVMIHNNGKTTITEYDLTTEIHKPFLETLRENLHEYEAPKLQGLPSFSGGFVGYLGYETVTWFEKIPTHGEDDLQLPDALFLLFEELVAFDHLKNQVIVFSNVPVDSDTDLESVFLNAHQRIDQLGIALHTDIDYQTPVRREKSKLHCNMSSKDFERNVSKAKDYIVTGDIFQIVLSQRFHRHTTVEPITIYRALRTINPSPYMFHLKLKDFDIIGASPELLVKVENGEVEIRPIAGTRPRGKDPEEDEKLARELSADEKERAEHLMLLDLGRNDIGRVAEIGFVQVKEFMEVEYYSHVMHIVSDVRGKLIGNRDVLDALMSGFPAGTTTGAPKIRAMELIHELEPTRRGVYSGAVGFIDFAGSMNTCIAIRTLVMKNGTVYFQSGAGIVYDSDPAQEYQETVNKAEAIMRAIDFAEDGLVK